MVNRCYSLQSGTSLVTCSLLSLIFWTAPAQAQVVITPRSDRAMVVIDGQPFTTLYFGEAAHKPFVHPLRSASGKIVTRGFPVDPQPGEKQGQPHQVGVWVGHEKLNGIDFHEVDPRMEIAKKRPVGTIVFKDITSVENGRDAGSIAFRADWVAPDGTTHVVERRRMTFSATPRLRIVDLDIRLQFPRRTVISDHADGLLGLRLGRPFEEENGGVLRNFAGATGADNLYARRSPWIDALGTIDGEKIGVAIFDHPDNYNFPTRWKTRAWASYFASNFGEQEFYHEKPLSMAIPPTAHDAGLTLEPGSELHFRYRIIVHPAQFDVDAAFREFAALRKPE